MNAQEQSGLLLEKWEEDDPDFDIGREQREAGFMDKPLHVAPIDKRQAAHRAASSETSILEVYPDAILVGTPIGTAQVAAVSPWFIVWVAFPGAGSMAYIAYLIIENAFYGENVVYAILSLLLCLVLVMMGMSGLREACFRPVDMPVLFNRRTREVVFWKFQRPRFWCFWRLRGRLDIVTAAWDDLRVRSYKNIAVIYSIVRTLYILAFLVPSPHEARKPIQHFFVGYYGHRTDEYLWMLYEHIRRYMEEDGPALREDEALREWRMGGRPQFPAEVLTAAGGEPLNINAPRKVAA